MELLSDFNRGLLSASPLNIEFPIEEIVICYLLGNLSCLYLYQKYHITEGKILFNCYNYSNQGNLRFQYCLPNAGRCNISAVLTKNHSVICMFSFTWPIIIGFNANPFKPFCPCKNDCGCSIATLVISCCIFNSGGYKVNLYLLYTDLETTCWSMFKRKNLILRNSVTRRQGQDPDVELEVATEFVDCVAELIVTFAGP
uniref:Uncharacterized protein n=1 Tax=Meloidogyne incognita TaxID=6306 RepID=A0A914M0N0_MELIC